MDSQQYNRMDDLIADCLTRQASPREYEQLSAWMDERPSHRTYVRRQLQAWYAAQCDLSASEECVDEALCRIRAKGYGAAPVRRVVIHRWLAVAVVVLLLLLPLSGFLIGSHVRQPHGRALTAETGSRGKALFTMPDGTKVWLNSNSKLTWGQAYGISNRDVTLSGEGYFEVAGNKRLPFRILSRELSLTVVGTKFNFRNRRYETNVTADLVEGSIRLSLTSSRQEMLLVPNQRMTYNRLTGQMTKNTVNAKHARLWTLSRMRFEDATVGEIMGSLQQYYQKRIVVSPGAASVRFYCNLDVEQESLDNILHNMSSTGKIHVSEQNGTYYVR